MPLPLATAFDLARFAVQSHHTQTCHHMTGCPINSGLDSSSSSLPSPCTCQSFASISASHVVHLSIPTSLAFSVYFLKPDIPAQSGASSNTGPCSSCLSH